MPALPPLLRALTLVAAVAALPARADPLAPPLRLATPDLRVPAPRPSLALAEPPADGSLDFDLLGEPEKPPPKTDTRALRLRRAMLKTHQAVGLGLIALQLATTTVGQLNYSDRFSGGPSTGRYQQSHALLAYTNLGVFVVNGGIALFAPEPPGGKHEGFDRVTLHKISMFTAAAGMAAQGALGVYTARREGYENQERFAQIHLAIGYATLAALLTGVGALVL